MEKYVQAKRAFGPDLIRAVAVTCVLLSHTFPGGTMFPIVALIRATLGMLGVEIFFVLSGYLIGEILIRQLHAGELDSRSGVVGFWKRRWFRTLPNYYLFLLLNIVIAIYVRENLPSDWWRFLYFGQGLHTVHPIFFTEAWSLAVEEWFYLLFPLCIWLLIKFFKNRSLAFWLSVGLFIILPTILRSYPWFHDYDNGMRKVTFLRMDAIMFGVILAFLKLNPKHWMTMKKLWPIGALGIILLALVSQQLGDKTYVFSRVLYFPLLSLSISLVLPYVSELSRPHPVLDYTVRKISLWSFSMYLSHGPIIIILTGCFVAAGWSTHGMNAAVISVLVWIGTLGISSLVYARYEKPLMDLREPK